MRSWRPLVVDARPGLRSGKATSRSFPTPRSPTLCGKHLSHVDDLVPTARVRCRMNEAKVKVGAIALGATFLAIALFSLRPKGVRLVRLEQRVVGRGGGPLGAGPGIILSLHMSGNGDHPVSDYQMRLWDERGRELPIEPLYAPGASEYLVPLGYADPIAKPRLEAWLNGKKVAETFLHSFPPPVTLPLVAQADAAYHLRRKRSTSPTPGMADLFLDSPHPSDKDVLTVSRLVRTDRSNDLAKGEFGSLAGKRERGSLRRPRTGRRSPDPEFSSSDANGRRPPSSPSAKAGRRRDSRDRGPEDQSLQSPRMRSGTSRSTVGRRPA